MNDNIEARREILACIAAASEHVRDRILEALLFVNTASTCERGSASYMSILGMTSYKYTNQDDNCAVYDCAGELADIMRKHRVLVGSGMEQAFKLGKDVGRVRTGSEPVFDWPLHPIPEGKQEAPKALPVAVDTNSPGEIGYTYRARKRIARERRVG